MELEICSQKRSNSESMAHLGMFNRLEKCQNIFTKTDIKLNSTLTHTHARASETEEKLCVETAFTCMLAIMVLKHFEY